MCNCGNCHNHNNCCCGCRKINFCLPRINFNLCGCRQNCCCRNDWKNECEEHKRPCCDCKKEQNNNCNCGRNDCHNNHFDKKESGYFYGNFCFENDRDDRKDSNCQCDNCREPRNDGFDGQNY